MKSPSDMTDSELDAAVAVEVFGARRVEGTTFDDGPRWFIGNVYLSCAVPSPLWGPSIGPEGVPKFSTDPSADYVVLVHVRETWGLREQNVFYDLLDHTWAVRTENRHRYVPENAGEYRPGDYARAALAAVRGRK